MKYSEEIEFACNNAWSLPGIEPPIGSKFIGKKKTENGEYLFYKDAAGNYYYQSQASIKFELEIEEKRKQKNRSVLANAPIMCQLKKLTNCNLIIIVGTPKSKTFTQSEGVFFNSIRILKLENGGCHLFLYTITECKINDKKEIDKYYSWNAGAPGCERESKCNKTPEEMAKQNAWIRTRDLRRIMELNFRGGDLHVTLTCKPDHRPDMTDALKVVRKFRDKLRNAYKKQDWICKYIITTELGERGAVHWHMIINNMSNECTSTSELIHQLWDRGRPYFVPLDDSREYQKLAEYIIKETSKRIAEGKTLEKLSYMPSRNLIKPVVKTKKVRCRSWRKMPKTPEGWSLDTDSLVNGFNKFTGLPYQHYTIRKIHDSRGSRRCST